MIRLAPAPILLAALALAATRPALAQWTMQDSRTTASLRGLSPLSPKVAWASGTHGTVLLTRDGGENWQPIAVRGADSLDFRDVEAFDTRNAVVLASGPGRSSRIFVTRDGGVHWALTFTNPDSAGFLDAIAFWDRKHGLAFGDPVGGKFAVFRTDDGGFHWKRIQGAYMPDALPDEGAFAASGTCLVTSGTDDAWFATGGAARARVFRTSDGGAHWQAVDTPVAAGRAAAGIFSLAFSDATHGVAVGGDYANPEQPSANVAFTADGGATWTLAPGPLPAGYRSGVAFDGESAVAPTSGATPAPAPWTSLVAVGTAGTSRSYDGGARWAEVDSANFNAVRFAPDGTGWAVGPDGRVGRWTPAPR